MNIEERRRQSRDAAASHALRHAEREEKERQLDLERQAAAADRSIRREELLERLRSLAAPSIGTFREALIFLLEEEEGQ